MSATLSSSPTEDFADFRPQPLPLIAAGISLAVRLGWAEGSGSGYLSLAESATATEGTGSGAQGAACSTDGAARPVPGGSSNTPASNGFAMKDLIWFG